MGTTLESPDPLSCEGSTPLPRVLKKSLFDSDAFENWAVVTTDGFVVKTE